MTKIIQIIPPLFLLAVLAGCLVDTSIPHDSKLSCSKTGQCPDGWKCQVKLGFCLAPGEKLDAGPPEDAFREDAWGEDVIPIHRAEDKALMCGTLYDKTTECETEARASFGDSVYAHFEQPRQDFIDDFCVVTLFADISDQELDAQLADRESIPLYPCNLFVPGFCQSLQEGLGDLPGC